MRWAVVVAIGASAGGCKQLLGLDDPMQTQMKRLDASAVVDVGPDGTGACVLHSDCASDACLPDGSCGDDTNVAYVAPTGTGTACTMAMPCATVSTALMTSQPYIKVTGTIVDAVDIARAVTVLADPGAQLSASATPKPAVQITGTVVVAIYDLEITGSSKYGIELSSGAATLTLDRVTIDSNGAAGISASGGTINVFRTEIDDNVGGGLELTGVTFDIENDFIVENGSATATFGGVLISGGASGTLAFDTIADNVVASGNVAGAQCSTSFQPSTYADDIIYNNGSSQVSGGAGACVFVYSDIGPEGVGGATNLDLDPMFVSAKNDHLQPSSPCIDAADPAATLAVDYDGQPRPYGPARDIGADEYVP